jgi:hypothetical protein
MNTELFNSKFSEFSGEITKKFSNLNVTTEELRETHGDVDQLATLISAKTGIPREEVISRINDVTRNFNAGSEKSFMDKVSAKFDELKHKFLH